jgi:hypothetical protein
MAETPLNALGVVEGLDVVEERGSQLSAGRPLRVVVDPGEFAFEGGEERLDGGVVVAAADGAERWSSSSAVRRAEKASDV